MPANPYGYGKSLSNYGSNLYADILIGCDELKAPLYLFVCIIYGY